jgi:hypothetical protein
MDRAKQQREARKNGIGEEDDLSFKPQINKRPGYLKKDEPTQNAPYRDPNDPFEQPLPGNKGTLLQKDIFEQPLGPAPQPLSNYVKPNGHDPRNQPTRTSQPSPSEGQYKSKFMQQYEQPAEVPYQPPQKSKVEVEADDTFMGSLRGGRDSGGWNDDTSNASIPQPKKVSYRRRKSSDQNQPPNNPVQPSRPSPRPVPEWNSDVGSGIPAVPSHTRNNVQSSPSHVNSTGQIFLLWLLLL